MLQGDWALIEAVAVPGEFENFLADDGIMLPSADEGEFYLKYPELTAVIPALEKGILKLGGLVVPKVHGKSAKDAIWINPMNSLCCSTVDDVLMMIKASDRISNSSNREGLKLIQWIPNFESGFEFRIFIQQECDSIQVLGITQKNCTSLYRHLLGKESMETREALRSALILHSSAQFHSLSEASVVDVRIDWQSGRVLVLDVEPELYCTDYCLFGDGEQLRANSLGTLLVVETEAECRLSVFNQNLLPLDLLQQSEQNNDLNF